MESDIDFDLSSVSDLNSEDGGDNVSLRLLLQSSLSLSLFLCPSLFLSLSHPRAHRVREVDRIRAPYFYDLLSLFFPQKNDTRAFPAMTTMPLGLLLV